MIFCSIWQLQGIEGFVNHYETYISMTFIIHNIHQNDKLKLVVTLSCTLSVIFLVHCCLNFDSISLILCNANSDFKYFLVMTMLFYWNICRFFLHVPCKLIFDQDVDLDQKYSSHQTNFASTPPNSKSSKKTNTLFNTFPNEEYSKMRLFVIVHAFITKHRLSKILKRP